jgi:acid phosphatase
MDEPLPEFNRCGILTAFVCACCLFTGCGGGSGTTMTAPNPPATPTVPHSAHVVMVTEENQEYSTVVGNTTGWLHLNALMAKGALATNYYADAHPSIPNYFMLTTGQTLTLDDNSTTVYSVDNIARRMLAANVSFKVYAEGITNGYVGGNTGLYLIRHNPFAMLSDVALNAAVAKQVIWPFSQFATDVANNTLPDFSFIVPNVDDDAHNGTPQQADTWLQTKVVTPLAGMTAFAAGGDGILIVDFDEGADTDTTGGGGHVSPVFWGPNVRVAYTQASKTTYQHESMLATVMASLGLPNPPGNAATAALMTEFFVQPK